MHQEIQKIFFFIKTHAQTAVGVYILHMHYIYMDEAWYARV